MFACHRGLPAVCIRRRGHPAALLALALALAATAAVAEENAAAAPEQILNAQQQAGVPRPMLEISTSEVPRFDDASTRASRTNLMLFPTSGSLLGISLGMTSSSGPASNLLGPYGTGAPMLDLGLHWRHEMDGSYRLDVTAWRRVGNGDALSLIQSRDPDYGARVEMGMASGRQGPTTGFVGVQLDGGARVTVRRSGGRPMLYYRNNF